MVEVDCEKDEITRIVAFPDEAWAGYWSSDVFLGGGASEWSRVRGYRSYFACGQPKIASPTMRDDAAGSRSRRERCQ